MKIYLILGDCLEKLKELPENSVDSIVTDPPYELGFMGKSWDNTGIANNKEMWSECLRVLKPGGYLLSFGGTRTYHRMACAIEDAGFEVRDMIEWVYGSGFPKSRNIGLDVDKRNGVTKNRGKAFVVAGQSGQRDKDTGGDLVPGSNTMGAYVAQNEWSGWGTALKPAHEPVIVSMKPLQVEQIFAILIDNIWKHLPASDAINNLRDTQATLNEVVNSVPENVKINFLENIDNVEFVETLTTSLATKSKKEKESSAQENVVQFGEKLSQETKTHTGEVEDVSLVDISTSVQMGDISENIVLLWKNLSEELLNQTNTLTTRMATKKIIELKTLRSCLIQNTGISTGHSTKIPPNHEPICMARKPLAEKTVAENVLKYGTGGINIDESRVGTTDDMARDNGGIDVLSWGGTYGAGKNEAQQRKENGLPQLGRFPANLIHNNSEEVRECFPETKSGWTDKDKQKSNSMFLGEMDYTGTHYSDNSGNASRFFKSIIYQAKASKSNRGEGNNHPTVKPIALMEYLIKMVTPKGGIVLDPFMGSGSTGVACMQNSYQFIGIELELEYMKIAEQRLKVKEILSNLK